MQLFRLATSLAVAFAFAGCSFEGTADSPGADDPDAAPNLGGDAGDVDADPGDPDRDSDGIDNDADNCPDIANAAQENEDLDLHGNLCDVCPHVVDDGQADGDADGVGDACDPQPGMTNTWLYFEGFDAALDGDDWVGEGGWNVSAGELHSNNRDDRYFLRNTTFDHGEDVEIGASMTFANPLGNNGINYRFGGPLGRGGANDSNNGCWAFRSIGEGLEGYVFVQASNGSPSGFSYTAGTLAAVVYDIRMTINNNAYDCAYQPGGGALVNLSRTTNTNINNSNVGVVSSFVETHVRYLYAISRQ